MNTLEVLVYGQRTIRSTVDQYGPDDWGRIALGVWTAKDLLGHLGAFEVRFADQLAPFAGAPSRPTCRPPIRARSTTTKPRFAGTGRSNG